MAGVLQPVHGTVAVCEAQPFWTPALQREFVASAYVVRGCRTPRELPALISTPIAMVVCDVTQLTAETLRWLSLPESHRWPCVACGSPAVAELEPVFRELGVRSFLTDLVSASELATLCRRWLTSGPSPF